MSSDLSDGDSSELVSDSESDSGLKTESEGENQDKKEDEGKKEVQEQSPEDIENKKEVIRFEQELEFVLCLANPRYIYSLAQRNYFGDTKFINFLKYLLYWCEPEYARFVRFPQSLQFLRYLQDPDFRKYVSNFANIIHIEQIQFKYWECYQRHRLDMTLPTPELKKPDPPPEAAE